MLGRATLTMTASRVTTKKPSNAASSVAAARPLPGTASPASGIGREGARGAGPVVLEVLTPRCNAHLSVFGRSHRSGFWQNPPHAEDRSYRGGMSAKSTDVRDFLVTRRAKITPEQAGLTVYGGNRRVPGLRREEVAMLAGVSADYYTRLEKGNLAGVSDTVLEAIAAALQLDEAERVYLFDLARAANAAGCPSVRPGQQ